MPDRLSADEIDRLARKRASAKLGWFAHAGFYLAVNLALFLGSEHGFGTRRWSLFPVVGWGIGLAFHGISVFILGNGSALRERLVEKERARLQREQDRNGAP